MNAGFVRKAMTFAAFGFALNVALLGTFIVATAQPTQTRPKIVTNDPATYRYAYQHGYRAGYEDGFTEGKTDFNQSRPRDFTGNEAFNRADRGYESRRGTKAEIEESYRTGFELAYNDGCFGRPFTVSLPSNLRTVVIAAVNSNSPPPQAPPVSPAPEPPSRRDANTDRDDRDDKISRRPIVPDGIQMKIRLNTEISTKTNREGDKFTAVVLDPSDYSEAII